MNQPHLRFEITSDDGFSVKASSIEGKVMDLGLVCSKAVFGYLDRCNYNVSTLPCCSGLAGSDRWCS